MDLREWHLAGGLFLVTAALVLIIWSIAPREDGPLLLGATQWSPTTLLNNQPPTAMLPDVYARSPDTRIWRNWPSSSPGRSWITGEVWSEAGVPPAIIGVPVGGNSQRWTGNRVLIECMTDHRQRPVAEIDVFSQMSLALVDMRGFCAGPVRIGAISEGRALLMLGTPIAVQASRAFAIRYLIPLLGALSMATAISLIWVAASLAAASAVDEDPRKAAIIGLLATGPVAMGMFWAFSLSHMAGIGALTFGVTIALAVIGHSQRHRRAGGGRCLAAPFGAWLIFGLLMLSLGQAIDSGGGFTAANSAFSPAVWSSDNQLQPELARVLARGLPFNHLFGSWLVSDRPPLLSGYLLLVENLLMAAIPDSLRFTLPIAEQAAGVMVMSLWVPATWLGLRLVGLREDFILLLICLTGCTGFVIFNSLYTWPKLCAGGFGLLMILSLAALREQSRSATALLSIAAVSAALALLSHGATIFGVIAALVVFAPAILRQGVRPVFISGTLAAALLASWWIWQEVYQPGGNVLARFALAGLSDGKFGFDRRNISVLSDVSDAYGKLTLQSYLQMKANALLNLLGTVYDRCSPPISMRFSEAGMGALRFHEFFHLAYTVAIPVLSAVVCVVFRADDGAERVRPMAPLLTVSIATFVLWLLVTWECHITHHFAYQAILATFVGCWALSFTANRKLATWLAAGSVVLTLAVWVIDPLMQALAVRWPWLLGSFVLLALGAFGATALIRFHMPATA